MASKHDVIVVGASAGGVEALQELVRGLPAEFPAALFVVLHLEARTKSFLPEILTKAGPLHARHATDGASIEHGRIYVAPPDCHLVIERGHMHLTSGPKEQHHRPSINVTFRSAALAYGERVAGVVMSGELDDGTAGLWEIERRRGITVVQNPEEAAFPSMPLSALREIEVDHTVTAAEMGPLLGDLATGIKQGVSEMRHSESERSEEKAQLTDLTCPECRGTIWEVRRGQAKDYRCRVGHTYSAKNMLAGHFAAQEKALYAAVVALEEGASLATRLADQFDLSFAERLRTEAREREAQAEAIRQVLKERLSFQIE
ncbi:MAG: chemotaxis protein CheB [Acidobacteriaceae bacterium]|nr:chemotaxis protein CheB [Acidobacteriaceae bacterium]MBV8573140.1 chemotaxis protein CheB [Acidobacteriaceae bacterium]